MSGVRKGPPTGKRQSNGDELIRRERCAESVSAIARASHRWDRTWVYMDVDQTTIIAAAREVPNLAGQLVIVLDGTLGLRQTEALLSYELDLTGAGH